MTLLILVVLALVALLGGEEPPRPTDGEWINNYVHHQAAREAELRRRRSE